MASHDSYLIISSDCHAGAQTLDYRPYVDPEYRERFDEDVVRQQTMMAEMRERMGLTENEFVKEWYEENEEGLRGGWDAEQRDKELNGDGVVGEIMFPGPDASGRGGTSAPFSVGFGVSGASDPNLTMAGSKAHNRWLADVVSLSPDRRRGLAVIPMHDIDGAVAEIRRSYDSGLRGVMVPPLQEPGYNDRRYDPVWTVCEELDMPVHTHTGPAPRDHYGANMELAMIETIWWVHRPVWFMLISGVFERFPGLKAAVAEGGCWWAADLLWKWDTAVGQEHATKKISKVAPNLTMLPSAYFDRNVKIGASNLRRREIPRRYEIGVDNIMWGNDFPHSEGTWPHTKEWLRDALFDVPIDETRKMLGLNAAEFYNFDVEKLRPLANEIGPTPEDLGQTGDHDDSKWDESREAGRPWITGHDITPSPVG